LPGGTFLIGKRDCEQMIREKKRQRGGGEERSRRLALRAVGEAMRVFGERMDENSLTLADYVRLLELAMKRPPERAKCLRVRWVEEW